MRDGPMPRPRFTLRAILAVTAIVAVWLGWNLYVVQQRRSVLESNPTLSKWHSEPAQQMWAHGFIVEDPEPRTNPASAYDMGYIRLQPTAPFRVSTLRKWMGDQPVWQIRYTPGEAPEEMQRLFPEAIIAYQNVVN